jgi:ribonuclease-3
MLYWSLGSTQGKLGEMVSELDDLSAFEERIQIDFLDRSLLLQALTHRSYVNENTTVSLQDNERLEFLGDAVLDFVVGAYLFNRYPETSEGELTMLRAALVRTSTLASFGTQIGIGECIRLGRGEEDSGGRQRQPTICAAFEAVVGAIFLDQGLEIVEPWVQRQIAPALDGIIAASSHKDDKSEFQIWAQAQFNITPRYQVLSSEGPDHDKTFTVAVLIGEKTWGIGRGPSKQTAAQEAAGLAMDQVAEADLSSIDNRFAAPETSG